MTNYLPTYDLDVARALFPVTRRFAYLAHAAHSPTSTRVAEAQQAFIEEQMTTGIPVFDRWEARLAAVRQSAARLIGATPQEIAFVKNTSHGLLHIANGLPWQAGDNIVTADLEFPSNVYPWLNLQRLGVETRFAPCRAGRVHLDDLAAHMDERTRLVALSFVRYNSGFRIDVRGLADLVHARGALLAVDSVQGLGALPFDVEAMGVDFMSASGHKWLTAPYGSGLLYVRRDHLDRLTPALSSWLGHQDPMANMERFDMPFWPDARRFEEGVPNWAALLGLGAAVDTLLEFGVPAIERHILGLNARLASELEACGYTVLSPRDHDGERSGILFFTHPTQPAAALEARLRAADVVVSVRNGALRVAPHFYNTWDDLQRLLEALIP